MSERRLRAEELLGNMGRLVVPVPDESELERQRVVDAVNRRLAGGLRSRLKQRLFFASAAAALVFAAGLAFAHFRRVSTPELAAARPSGADVFKPGDTVRTEPQEFRAGSLENGARVSLSGGTVFSVSVPTRGADELVLDRGRVELSVPKLHSGHTLSVTTPDSTVTVRGTRFAVGVALLGSRAITSVEVTEGSVWVRKGDARLVLEAGSRWSSNDAERAPPAPQDPAPVANSEESTVASPAARAVARPSSAALAPVASHAPPDARQDSALPSSTLAEENNLYAAAARATRDGNSTLAISELNKLLSRYPNSPLAQNARVDRFRVLQHSGRAEEAVIQARRYLADYPNGFARDEAKTIVLQALVSP